VVLDKEEATKAPTSIGHCVISIGSEEAVSGPQSDNTCLSFGISIGKVIKLNFTDWSRRFDGDLNKCIYRFQWYAEKQTDCSELATKIAYDENIRKNKWLVGSRFLPDVQLVSDGNVDSSELPVIANSTPVARRDFVQTDSVTPVGGNVFDPEFGGADYDPDQDSIKVHSVQGSVENVGQEIYLESGSKIVIESTGEFYFDPREGFKFLTEPGSSSADRVTYSIIDSKGGVSGEVLSMFSVVRK